MMSVTWQLHCKERENAVIPKLKILYHYDPAEVEMFVSGSGLPSNLGPAIVSWIFSTLLGKLQLTEDCIHI